MKTHSTCPQHPGCYPDHFDPLCSANFAVTELNLYLDTHPDDREALAAFCAAAENLKHARKQYRSTGKNIQATDAADPHSHSFSWVEGKFPWEV